MKRIHEIRFPRYDDVHRELRTVFHMPVDEAHASTTYTVGDELLLLAAPGFPRAKVAIFTDVKQVRLLDVLDVDLANLGSVDRAEYLSRWDELHVDDAPSSANPLVWRIEFRYGGVLPSDPPEWSLAA